MPDFHKPQALEARYNLARLEDRQRAHSGDAHRLGPDELRFKMRLAIFEEHGDHFGEIGLNLIQTRTLTMRSTKTRNVSDQDAGLGIALDHRRICPQNTSGAEFTEKL